MKRRLITVALGLFAVAVMLAPSGCGSTNKGRYYQRTGRKTHVHKDRIRNPSDFRYAQTRT